MSVLSEAHRQQRQGRAEEVGPQAHLVRVRVRVRVRVGVRAGVRVGVRVRVGQEAHERQRDADHHADLGVVNR